MILAAELVREKLLAIARDELPHSITVSVEEMEDVGREALTEREIPEPVLRLRATIHVERESQRGIVIGQVLKDAGTAARHELEALLGVRVYLETRVQVERDWQRRPHALDRLGY